VSASKRFPPLIRCSASYADFDISFEQEVLDFHRESKVELGGALHVFAERAEIEVIPTYSARAITSGGTLRAESFARIAGEFLDAVRRGYEQVNGAMDGIYLSLHGAMGAEGEDDSEGYLLAGVRQVITIRLKSLHRSIRSRNRSA